MSLPEARQFVRRFVTGEYTPEEHAAFLRWLKEATVEEIAIIAETHESFQGEWVLPDGPSSDWMVEMERKLDTTEMDDREEEEMVPVVWMKPKKILRWNSWMTAAAVVVVLSAGTYTYVHQLKSGSGGIKDREKLLAMTFTTPRGTLQKEFVLEDGSKVWLNAGSTLKYPVHFSDNERLVELSGEAFFDVTGSTARPFRVLIKDAEVEVLGTYFAIWAYDDEPESRTTLVNGAVKVVSGQSSEVLLKPGQQAKVVYSSPVGEKEIIVRSDNDAKPILDWQSKGIYSFKGQPLRTLMRELERVYDVHVQYQSTIDNPPIDANLDLTKGLDIVLEQLEGSLYGGSKVHFTHNGKTVIASSV